MNKGYKIFHLERVAYGKKDTPLELREYKVIELRSNAVGTINEFADFLKNNAYSKKIILRTNDSGDFRFNFYLED